MKFMKEKTNDFSVNSFIHFTLSFIQSVVHSFTLCVDLVLSGPSFDLISIPRAFSVCVSAIAFRI